MSMLTGNVDAVIGVDTHRDTHTVAVVDPTGGVLATTELATDAFGYRRMLAFAVEHAPGRRVWAIEGTGSFGAGLTTYLLEKGEWVAELDRPARRARRDGAKTDTLDAVRAAREALSREHLAQPRQRGDREAMRVLLTTRAGTVVARTKAICQLKALIVGAPESLREQMRRGSTDQQLDRCARLRTVPSHSVEHRCTVRALRTCARQALFLEAQAADLETELEQLVTAAAPQLLTLTGVGVITAAQILISWFARRPSAQRGRVCRPRRGSTDPSQLRPDRPLPAQPLWGPPAQPGAAHHRAFPPGARRTDQAVRRPPHLAGQDPPRDQAMPQTRRRPPGLPATRGRGPRPRRREGRRVTATPSPAVRDDGVTTPPAATCPSCGTSFRRNGRRRFCSAACRQANYRAQRQTPAPPPRHCTTSVYECPVCSQRYLGEQRCTDCNVFCRRLGAGGECPHCGDPVTITDITPKDQSAR